MTLSNVGRRGFLAAVGLLLLNHRVRADNGSAIRGPDRLVLLPLGTELPARDVEFVSRCLETFYNFRVDILDRSDLPKSAYYSPRQRYRADKLLDYLDRVAPADATRILGLTGVDISTTRGSVYDWGVLGLASIDGRVGVLSKLRCSRGTKTVEEALYRFGKTAVHELGHTLGLQHCPRLGCLMEDAKGTVLTTDREYDLCPSCRARLESHGRAALLHPNIPWPKPINRRVGP
ncbi:MAG TPA: hypothetical protein VIV60_07345 [Polyangiaceae bacterium]